MQLELREGGFTALIGAPGSGKSTLLQHLNGLLLPSEGSVTVQEYKLEAKTNGKRGRRSKVSVPAGLRKKVGLVFQFPEQQLFEETIEKDLCFGPLNYGASQEEAIQAARKSAALMGLGEDLLQQSPFQVSDGQMRKVAIAGVLAANPDIIVLDEPTASLDQISREELMRLLHNLCRKEGRTIVVVTHQLEDVMPFADEFIVMSEGKVIFQGDAGAMLRQAKLLEEARVVLPPSARLMLSIAERFDVTIPDIYMDAKQTADWIGGLMDAK